MAETIIKNEYLTVTLKSKGAEIKSVKNADGVEFMWEANPEIWGFSAPILFPICGGLREDKFYYEGKEYSLAKHGYAKLCEFELESENGTEAVYLLRSNEETKKCYPFDYEFRAKFSLDKNKLAVTYSVKNLTDGKMYTDFGGHEAYACPGGVGGYRVIFDEKENLDAACLEGNHFNYETRSVGKNTDTLELNDEFFKTDALAFLNLKSRGVVLEAKDGSRKIRVDYPEHPYVLLWTTYKAPYLCIEPWIGMPDRVDANQQITDKEGIVEIEKGGSFERTHTITFEA